MYIACVTVAAMFRERKYEYEYVGEKKSDTLCADSGIGTQCSYRGRCAGNRQILDTELPGSPAIPLLHKCPRELKANTKIDYLHTCVHGSVSHSSQEGEAAQCLQTHGCIQNCTRIITQVYKGRNF